MSQPIRMAQYGTKHGHASGVLQVMLDNPDVEVVGVYEPDTGHRTELQLSGQKPWSDISWFDSPADFLEDPTLVAVASEGLNVESLDHTEQIIEAGKHVFYDKPAGTDYTQFSRVIDKARRADLLVQLGYMFRYHDGYQKIAEWAHNGMLGHVYAIRAHMSTSVSEDRKARFPDPGGGVFYDLASHQIDQIVWILGRPRNVISVLHTDHYQKIDYIDNSVGLLEYDDAIAIVDIASMEPPPAARRFEIYGSEGSVIMEPMEPADSLRLCLTKPKDGYSVGINIIEIETRPRYVMSLEAFISNIRGERKPDRALDHELLVQETLLRATGHIPS